MKLNMKQLKTYCMVSYSVNKFTIIVVRKIKFTMSANHSTRKHYSRHMQISKWFIVVLINTEE